MAKRKLGISVKLIERGKSGRLQRISSVSGILSHCVPLNRGRELVQRGRGINRRVLYPLCLSLSLSLSFRNKQANSGTLNRIAKRNRARLTLTNAYRDK